MNGNSGSSDSTKPNRPAYPVLRSRVLKGLKYFRRKHYLDAQPWWEKLLVWSAGLGFLLIFMGAGLQAFTGNPLLTTLGFWAIFLTPIAVIALCWFHVTGALTLLVLRIPRVLFFQSRMHLTELMLLVVLLGNGIGLIVAYLFCEAPALTVFLMCGVWILIVLGGAAWGLWVCAALDVQQPGERFGLILTGILTPAAGFSIGCGPFAIATGLELLFEPNDDWAAFITFGAGGMVSAAYLLRYAFARHIAAANAAKHARAAQLRRASRRHRKKATEQDQTRSLAPAP